MLRHTLLSRLFEVKQRSCLCLLCKMYNVCNVSLNKEERLTARKNQQIVALMDYINQETRELHSIVRKLLACQALNCSFLITTTTKKEKCAGGSRPLVFMENNPEHFTARVLAHWCAWGELESLHEQGRTRGRGQRTCTAAASNLRAIWEFQVNTGERKYSGRPTEDIKSQPGHSESQFKT